MSTQSSSPRTEIHRLPQRGHHDQATIHAIIDDALVCHVAFNQGGSVHCLPTACWRSGDALYIHGANNSRMAQALAAGECSVCITHLDGLVLARSAFHHSMNYRSAVIYGQFCEITDPDAKRAALNAFVEHVSPGRSALVRAPSRAELAGTRVLHIPLSEAVAKVREGGPKDDDDDLAIPVWAGVIPVTLQPGELQPEADSGTRLPATLPGVLKR